MGEATFGTHAMEHEDLYPLLKALHLVAMVAYFASLFHLARLYVAHREALRQWEPERGILASRFASMERNTLRYMAWPALLVLVFVGIWSLWLQPALLKQPYMHVKLTLVLILVLYQIMAHRLQGRLQRAELRWSAFGLHAWATGAVLLPVALIAVVVLRDRLTWIWSLLGASLLAVVIWLLVLYGRQGSVAPQKAEDAGNRDEGT